MNSEQRAAVEFCNPCRSQIIVAGIYCNPDGSPILKEAEDGQKKPQFVFIRGKGTKYNNVSTYLNECFQMEYPPIFDPVTEESTKFEKSVVNNKRHVTKITMGTAPSAHGEKDVFVLSKGSELDPKTVYQILQVTKKTLDKFNDKFDWSKGAGAAASSYAPQEEGVMTFDEEKKQGSEPPKEEKAPEPEPQKENFSFDDVNF